MRSLQPNKDAVSGEQSTGARPYPPQLLLIA